MDLAVVFRNASARGVSPLLYGVCKMMFLWCQAGKMKVEFIFFINEEYTSSKLYELPELQEINRLPMHGAEIPFADMEQALERKYENSDFFRSLFLDMQVF